MDILLKPIENPNKIFSRQEIIDSIWGDEVYITERTVDVHITRLRKKKKIGRLCIGNYQSF